jgi:serine/threonine protein phosphatase PrpC
MEWFSFHRSLDATTALSSMKEIPKLAFAAATDIGCQRSNNEDSFGYDAEQHLYVVCDGMGGSAAGEVASETAVRVLIETFESQALAAASGQTDTALEERLLYSIHEANRVVHELAETYPQYQDMGTTLVCACIEGNRVLVGNVGDSRAYLIRNAVCLQITQDHSLLDEQIRNGVMTPEMAANSNLQSVITRAIGPIESVEPDFFAAELQANDMLLLASDGLTRYIEPSEIAALVAGADDLKIVCQHLIDHAKQRGGADNITCMLLRAVEVPLSPQNTELNTATSTI